jgi:hypothetical protein
MRGAWRRCGLADHSAERCRKLAHRSPFHRQFSLQACKIAIDRGDGEHAAPALVFQQAIFCRDIAVDRNLVPLFGVADVIDRHVVMLAPEKWHRVERLALSQHIARGGLALALRHHPMLNADVFFRVRIGPARDIARGVDAGDAGLEISIHRDAAVERETGLFRQRQPRTHPDADDHHIGFEHAAALERRALAVDPDHGIAEMEDDAVLFVQRAHEIAHLRAEHALHRPLLGCDDMDLKFARTQRRRGLKPDKARADHNCAARACHRVNDRPAIAERTQRTDMRLIGARNRQPHRLSAGRQQKTVIGNAATAGDNDVARLGIDRGDLRLEPQVDAGFGIKAVRAQRQPILRRAAGEVILRQVRPVDRRRGIIAQHHDAASKLLPPQHLGRRESRSPSADDHDLAGRIGGSVAARLRLFALLPDQDAIAFLLDLPDCKCRERRRARGVAGAQIETGVMPGTADAFADHESFGERPVVVTAMRVDGENLRSGTHQQNILIADMSEQCLAGEFNALGEIRPGGWGLRFSHGLLPRMPCGAAVPLRRVDNPAFTSDRLRPRFI